MCPDKTVVFLGDLINGSNVVEWITIVHLHIEQFSWCFLSGRNPFQVTILFIHRRAPALQQHEETFGTLSQNLPLPALFLSKSVYNCQVTHHPDTQDVRETGLMIHISQHTTWTCAWICGHVRMKLPEKRLFPLFALVLLLQRSVMLPEMSQHQQTLFKWS